MTIKNSISLAEHAAILNAHPDYRVLQRFVDSFPRLPNGAPEGASVGLVLDTETTGKERTDVMVELGIVAFAYDATSGEILGIVDTYSGLEDPGAPMSEEVMKVHGISNEMVQDQEFDDAKVQALLDMATFVVAHNSAFDRPKVEARYPNFASVAWACSMSQLPWVEVGLETRKLKMIALELGYFYEAHRALEDSMALLQLLALPVPNMDGRTGLQLLLAAYLKPTFTLWARNSPFASKDVLKARGYRWSAGDVPGHEKAWFTSIDSPDALAVELAWLKEHVYYRAFSVPVTQNDALMQFSGRLGQPTMHYMD